MSECSNTATYSKVNLRRIPWQQETTDFLKKAGMAFSFPLHICLPTVYTLGLVFDFLRVLCFKTESWSRQQKSLNFLVSRVGLYRYRWWLRAHKSALVKLLLHFWVSGVNIQKVSLIIRRDLWVTMPYCSSIIIAGMLLVFLLSLYVFVYFPQFQTVWVVLKSISVVWKDVWFFKTDLSHIMNSVKNIRN